MYKLKKVPMAIIVSSSSCLVFLAIGALLLATNTAYTSDVLLSQEAHLAPVHEGSNEQTSERTNHSALNSSDVTDSRRRSGRIYDAQSDYGAVSQSTMDSYGASQVSASNPTVSGQPNSEANDASSFASFGELPPSSPGSGSLPNGGSSSVAEARHYAPTSSLGHYAPHHTSYYASYMSPSSSAISYTGQQQNYGHQGSNINNGNSYNPGAPSSGYSYHKHGYPSSTFDRINSANSRDYHDRVYLNAASSQPIWASSPSSSTGLMASASSALSHWTGGFSIAEIICALIAVSIGAVILGAPFFLIYLALMGNFSGSGTLSLTNPTQQGTGTATGGGTSTTTNGRRKRLAIYKPSFEAAKTAIRHNDSLGSLADVFFSNLSPLMDVQQVTTTFKRLISAIDNYSSADQKQTKKAVKTMPYLK